MWDFICKLLGLKKKEGKVIDLTTRLPKRTPAPEVQPKPEKEEPKKVSRISQKCVDLVKKFEGLVLHPYLDAVNIPTIGYGNTQYEDGTKVTMDDPPITEERANELLMNHLSEFAEGVMARIKVPVSQNQIDALTSFSYNVGLGAFGSSTLLKLLNKGDYKGASGQFVRWNKAGGKVLAGLTRRREAERDLFDGYIK